ncbi:MAG: DNA-processing protein DprA [Patescibacteria group bacterium]
MARVSSILNLVEEKVFYNALCVATQSAYRTLKNLKERFGSWKDAWQNFPDAKTSDPRAEFKKLEACGVRLVLLEDPEYPAPLKEISWAPFGLYVRGTMGPEELPIAVVGTRKATPQGKELARQYAGELARAGATIVSGLALGIDAAAHEGCLAASGRTIAVLGSGLDRFYPATNARLGEKILSSGGVVLSEYPLGSPALPYRFLERNRIISGLSRGVLVIEAPSGSGALATARFAMEQNRDVFVVPGPVTHPNYAGSHELIRQGAELVTGARDVLASFGVAGTERPDEPDSSLTKEETLILQAVRAAGAPLPVDKIVQATNLEAQIVNQTLSFLLMKNKLRETAAGFTF